MSPMIADARELLHPCSSLEMIEDVPKRIGWTVTNKKLV